MRSVRTPRWRYVANPDGAAPACSPFRRRPERYRIGRRELYDLAADPGEQRDVAAAHPDVVRELDATLDTWAETHARPTPAAEIRPDAAAELRALGYID